MMTETQPYDNGWGWHQDNPKQNLTALEKNICKIFARCLGSPDGKQIQDHLKRVIMDRRLGPAATNAELRHLEGQRFAVAYVLSMINRGQIHGK